MSHVTLNPAELQVALDYTQHAIDEMSFGGVFVQDYENAIRSLRHKLEAARDEQAQP